MNRYASKILALTPQLQNNGVFLWDVEELLKNIWTVPVTWSHCGRWFETDPETFSFSNNKFFNRLSLIE